MKVTLAEDFLRGRSDEIAVGAITDAMGNLSVALNVSAAMLALGAVLAAFQRKLVQVSAS